MIYLTLCDIYFFIDRKQCDEKEQYHFLDVQVLRECLKIELKVSGIPFTFNLENAIDDWIFLCFFLGNDFLPSLKISEDPIDTLIKTWKRCLPLMGGYLTDSGIVSFFFNLTNLLLYTKIQKRLNIQSLGGFKKITMFGYITWQRRKKQFYSMA